MTRTDVYKALYFAKVAAVVALVLGALLAGRSDQRAFAVALTVLAVLLLISGRVQAAFWSDLLAGLHRLNQRDYVRSKAHSERFIAQLYKQPWLRRLSWLAPSSYTLNAEVMALNNLGAAELALEDFDAARAHLTRAIALDPKCPLPYRNMGVLTLRAGEVDDAAPWFEKAVALGFKGDWTDRRAMASQRNNAAFSARDSG